VPPSPPVRSRATPPSTTPFRPLFDQIRYCDCIPTSPRCLCAPYWFTFTGPSPGTCAHRHGHRHLSSPAMLRHCSLSTSPTIVISSSCRPCSTYPFPPKTSPPARTPRTDPPAAVESCQGLICNFFPDSKGLCAST
jgi:hypothetical protein